MKWLERLRGDPLSWLLERENPAVRYWTKVATALEYLLSRQLPDGTWSLNQNPYRLPFDAGQPGEPNEWLTLDAMRVIKLFSGQDRNRR